MNTSNDLMIDSFERVKVVVHRAVEGLSEEELARRPGKTANSIAWLVWHLTRIQDDHIAELAGREQVWMAGGWVHKFNLPFGISATGYGHSTNQVAAVRLKARQLLDYYDAAHDETINFIKTLQDSDYRRIVDKSWDPPVTLAVRLVSVISDDLQHAGQAAYIRGLLK